MRGEMGVVILGAELFRTALIFQRFQAVRMVLDVSVGRPPPGRLATVRTAKSGEGSETRPGVVPTKTAVRKARADL